MRIEGKGPGATPAERLQAVGSREGAVDQQNKSAAEGATRSDRVEISAAGRVMAGVDSGAEAGNVHPVPAGAPDRLAQVRARVEAGFYATDAVQSAVAHRIIARGDHR
jgi:hypothetical protein